MWGEGIREVSRKIHLVGSLFWFFFPPPLCCLEHRCEGCTAAAVLWHGGDFENGSQEEWIRKKEPESLIIWICYAIPESPNLWFTLWERKAGSKWLLFEIYVICWWKYSDMTKTQRHFHICPSLQPLFCLWRFSWSNISVMTLWLLLILPIILCPWLSSI